jgi:hypothetical protein
VKTFANPDVRVIDLRKANLDAKTIQFIALDQPQMARDLTP